MNEQGKKNEKDIAASVFVFMQKTMLLCQIFYANHFELLLISTQPQVEALFFQVYLAEKNPVITNLCSHPDAKQDG